MKTVQSRVPDSVCVTFDTIPTHQSDAICRNLIGCVSRLFENPAVKADYERWRAERQKK